jgi:hypothetical protein
MTVANPAMAPLPNATADAVGNWKRITGSLGAALSLPAGGTWAYLCFYKNDTTNLTGSYDAGIKAGGAQLLAAGAAQDQPQALVWRIS